MSSDVKTCVPFRYGCLSSLAQICGEMWLWFSRQSFVREVTVFWEAILGGVKRQAGAGGCYRYAKACVYEAGGKGAGNVAWLAR